MIENGKKLLEDKIRNGLKKADLLYGKITEKQKEVNEVVEDMKNVKGDSEKEYQDLAIRYKSILTLNYIYNQDLDLTLSNIRESYEVYDLLFDSSGFSEDEESRLEHIKTNNSGFFELRKGKLVEVTPGALEEAISYIAVKNRDGYDFVKKIVQRNA